MPDCKVDLTNRDPSFIAKELTRIADGFAPWRRVRSAAFWFAIGAITIAAMDYGDVWFCVGQCDAAQHSF